MPVLNIRKYPDKILHKRCKPVLKFSTEILNIINDMFATLESNNGLGLAANQVGINLRIIVVKVGKIKLAIINPKIVKRWGGKNILEEGCLSFPGVYLKIKRYDKLLVRGLSIDWQNIEIESTGLLSRVLQHEIDHINGIVFVDRLPFLKKLKTYIELRRISRTWKS